MTGDGSAPAEVRARICGRKTRHPTMGAAAHHVQELEKTRPGESWAAYLCPFAPPGRPHFHVDGTPSLAALEDLARAMRGLPADLPTPHDLPPRDRRRRSRKDRRNR